MWVMAKSGTARYFESVKIGSPPFNRSLPLGRSWRTAAHAYAHHNHKEKVFGEWVFGCQGAIPFSPHKGKLGDQRMIDPTLPYDPDSKVNACVDNVYRIWEEHADTKATQLVFCDRVAIRCYK